MIYASLPELPGGKPRPLPFYLAMEEHLARNYPRGEYFFMWQVEPTVIYGRCQNPLSEVNLEHCLEKGIQTYRRKSGGGCVYADLDNIMFSHVTTSHEVVTTFSRYCRTIADTLRALGLDASATGRNDILIGDRKVSGNAFYHLHGRSILHGTMLFDADLPAMARAITPSRVKLSAKGVSSVRSYVTTIREHLPDITLGEFREFFRTHLCDSEQTMTREDIAEIERLARPYFTDEWRWGHFGNHSGGYAEFPRRRVEGVGEFAVSLDLEPATATGGAPRIRHVSLQGDFFLLSDLDEALLDRLRGVEYTPEALHRALAPMRVADVIAGLTPLQLVRLLLPAGASIPDGAAAP